MRIQRLIFLFLPSLCVGQSYITEPTLKLMSAEFFGLRFPASASDNRISLDGGVDVRVPDLGDLEVANNLPEEQLVLHPGGRVVYDLPMTDKNGKVDTDIIFIMVKPGKKDPPPMMGNPFTDKADIVVQASPSGGGDPVSIACSVDDMDFSSYASDYCILSIEPIIEQIRGNVVVTIEVPNSEERDAVLWQVQLSTLDDSKRIMGTFQEEARSLFRSTQSIQDFNTWLTIVSCVGKTGVGKSTVASLLSGNDTMFVAQSSSHGTTTLGADISTIIPAIEYKQRVEEVLEVSLEEPVGNKPLFLVDSEGMKFRGDEVDFVTTGPVAIIANVIVWITEGRMRPPDILEELRHYLKGLDRISLSEGSNQGQDYGEFVVILNKMQDSDQDYSDEQLCANLLAWGQSDEDDLTIAEMNLRFKSITCVGLPLVHLEEGEQFGYGVIKRYPRFVNGLKKLSNKLIIESKDPKEVKIGEEIYTMNSTNAETIVGLLIDGANQGQIDLTDPCNVIFSLYKEQVIQGIERMDSELSVATNGKCEESRMACSKCVCEYRNKAVEDVASKLYNSVTAGVTEADLLCVDRPDVKQDIASLIDDMIRPWQEANLCLETTSGLTSEGTCDISEMQEKFNTEVGSDITVECDTIHMCGTTLVHNSLLTLKTSNLFVSSGYHIIQEAPTKAASGRSSAMASADGKDGEAGKVGKGITLTLTNSLLTSSSTILAVTLNGGEGGDGGNGGNGNPGIPGVNGKNGVNGQQGANGNDGSPGIDFHPDHSTDVRYCNEIKPYGGARYGDITKYDGEGHCCCVYDASVDGYLGMLAELEARVNTGCHYTYKYYQHIKLDTVYQAPYDSKINGGNGSDGEPGTNGTPGTDGTDATPPTNGGKGGNGGPGGVAGEWSYIGNITLQVILTKNGGKGGKPGIGGTGGQGAEGGKKGTGGDGGQGGMKGRPGAPGQAYQQRRLWDAIDNWHTTAGCHGFMGCSSNEQVHQDPCTGLTSQMYPKEVYYTGQTGQPGKVGEPGVKGNDGKDGLNVKDALDGENGLPGKNAVHIKYVI